MGVVKEKRQWFNSSINVRLWHEVAQSIHIPVMNVHIVNPAVSTYLECE